MKKKSFIYLVVAMVLLPIMLVINGCAIGGDFRITVS